MNRVRTRMTYTYDTYKYYKINISITEYISGVGGRKPAQQFTWEERGLWGVNQNYYFWKPFWMRMQRLIDKGCTEAVALNKIQPVYDRFGSITNILRKLVKDEQNEGHRYLEPNWLYSGVSIIYWCMFMADRRLVCGGYFCVLLLMWCFCVVWLVK